MQKIDAPTFAYCVEAEPGPAGDDTVFPTWWITPSLTGELFDKVATTRASTGNRFAHCIAKVLRRLAGHGRRKPPGDDRLLSPGSEGEKSGNARIHAALEAGEPVDLMPRLRSSDGSAFRNSFGPGAAATGDGLRDPRVVRGLSPGRPTEVTGDRAAALDNTTGRLDRRSFLEAVERRLKTHAGATLVVMLDVVGFHDINVGYGFAVGDALLEETGRRLRRTGAAAVGRVGSDEFALAFDLAHKASAPRIVAEVCDALSSDFTLPETSVPMHFAVGYAVGEAGCGASSLIRRADIALRSAKMAPLGGPRRFERADEDEARRRVRIDRELSLAIANDEFVHHFQPQIALSTGECVGAEALMRREHPFLGN
jgi:diguanylate cyclase (GGDEF)-like protein